MKNLIFLYFKKKSANIDYILALQAQYSLFNYFKYLSLPSSYYFVTGVLAVNISVLIKKLSFLLNDEQLLILNLNNKSYTVKQFLLYKAYIFHITLYKNLFLTFFQFKLNLIKFIFCLKKKCLVF